MKLSKKLQYMTIAPLIIGIIISSFSSIAIMFSEHLTWLGNSRDELRAHEKQHFEYVSKGFAETFIVLVETVRDRQVGYSLIYISKTYEGVKSGALLKDQELEDDFVRFEDCLGKFK